MARLSDFPNCCKAKVVGGFGETPNTQSYTSCVRDIKSKIRACLERNQVFLTATSTKCQKDLNKALREAGFKRTKYHKKSYQHGVYSTKVALWHLPLEETYELRGNKVCRKEK